MKLVNTKLESSEAYLIKYRKICRLVLKIMDNVVEMRYLKYVHISKDFFQLKNKYHFLKTRTFFRFAAKYKRNR